MLRKTKRGAVDAKYVIKGIYSENNTFSIIC